MATYIIRRTGALLLSIALLSVIVFFLMHAAPGGPFAFDKPLPPQQMENIFRKYGLDRPIWEQYSTDRWREIRGAYNVTQVLTYNDWTLRLPLVAQSAGYLLYEIPE